MWGDQVLTKFLHAFIMSVQLINCIWVCKNTKKYHAEWDNSSARVRARIRARGIYG